MKKEKSISDEEILAYINEQIYSRTESKKVESLKDIASLLNNVSVNLAVKLLEDRLGDFESDKNKDLTFFDSFIQLSEYYLALKQYDNSFQTLRRAAFLATNFNEKFDYLWKHKIIAERMADVSIKQKDPKYNEYLYYSVVAFILEIAKDITAFPHLSGFFYRKKICFNKEWAFDDENFNEALKTLNIFAEKDKLLNDLYVFTFDELPIKMGIPVTYLKEDLLNVLDFKGADDKGIDEIKYGEWRKISDFQQEFDKKLFNELPLIHEYTNSLLGKYIM